MIRFYFLSELRGIIEKLEVHVPYSRSGRGRNRLLDIRFGRMTLIVEKLKRCLERAAMSPARMLRIILEEEGSGKPPGGDVGRSLNPALPLPETHGIPLAIENHFAIPCKILAEAAASYPQELVGLRVDGTSSGEGDLDVRDCHWLKHSLDDIANITA